MHECFCKCLTPTARGSAAGVFAGIVVEQECARDAEQRGQGGWPRHSKSSDLPFLAVFELVAEGFGGRAMSPAVQRHLAWMIKPERTVDHYQH